MIYLDKHFSDHERCAKLPQISAKWEPDRMPIREAVKDAFLLGLFKPPEEAAEQFLADAAAIGFEYPNECEPYDLAKDYASWIEGALRILHEDRMSWGLIPPYSMGAHEIRVRGYTSGTGFNVVRAVSELGQRYLRWSELIILAFSNPETVTVHQVKLPSLRKKNHCAKVRLASPLSLAYEQPMTGGLRLQKLAGESGKFGSNWKRMGRWEMPEVSWQEWREGIDRDRCLDSIIETYTVPALGKDGRRRLLNDIEHIMADMSKLTHPRKWEACENCIFTEVCHGRKHGFHRKVVQRSPVQRQDEADLVLS